MSFHTSALRPPDPAPRAYGMFDFVQFGAELHVADRLVESIRAHVNPSACAVGCDFVKTESLLSASHPSSKLRSLQLVFLFNLPFFSHTMAGKIGGIHENEQQMWICVCFLMGRNVCLVPGSFQSLRKSTNSKRCGI
jgi:hypothetical protein